MTNVLDHYFEWLCNKIGYQEEYYYLLEYLFNNNFIWVIDMDENRALDGLYLRRRFVDEEGVRGDPFENRECTILEMLVALSIRLEDEIMGDPNLEIFWKMLDNLGLTKTGNQNIWHKILQGWMYRTSIRKNGSGGLFPLSHPRDNQANVEIWGQAMDYLNEILGW